MAQEELALKVVLAFTGECIAELNASSSWTLAEVAEKLVERRPLPLGLNYELAASGLKLPLTSFLADALEDGTSGLLELQAFVTSVRNIVLPGISGAAQLPNSGDIIIASHCDITSGLVCKAVGQDDGPESYMWLWRLRHSDGYSLDKAVLLTRRQVYGSEELRSSWKDCVDFVKEGGFFNGSAFTTTQVEELGENPERLPKSEELNIITQVSVHSERYALLAWNSSGIMGSMGYAERLDTETGEVVCLAKLSDIWKVVSDPRDGRLFCSTCYSGFTVSLIQGSTVSHPDCEAAVQAESLVLANMGPGFDLDLELCGGALVEVRDGNVLLALPPDADPDDARKVGAVEYNDTLDPNYPPGDKSKPWKMMRIEGVFPPRGDESSFFLEFARMSICSRGSAVSFLDPCTKTVHTGRLGSRDTESVSAPQAPAAAHLVAATGSADGSFFFFRSV
eukprot:TRINITY_DN35279_c0_g1_i1.p1 TRINITY_DN35279_c0_g1~~TRINITY_DN35279_c0_g1_i1.p1  ORF type:complete len:451 (-),score=99.96 TRINITY_DN35279_c0_g1_i1:184-1536(-)